MRLPILLACATIGLAACSTSQPIMAVAKDRYQADAATCDKSAAETVSKRNAKRALTWFASPITRWSQITDNANGCMHAKGWGITRPCTDEERRQGNQTGTLVVTARGITCKDPGRPS